MSALLIIVSIVRNTRKEPKGIEKIILDVMDWFKYGRTDPENRDYK